MFDHQYTHHKNNKKNKGLLTKSTNYKHILLRYPHALFCLQWFVFKLQNLYLTNQEFFFSALKLSIFCEMEHSSSPTRLLHFSILFPSSPSLCCRLFPVHAFLPSIIFFHFSSLIVDLIYLSISPPLFRNLFSAVDPLPCTFDFCHISVSLCLHIPLYALLCHTLSTLHPLSSSFLPPPTVFNRSPITSALISHNLFLYDAATHRLQFRLPNKIFSRPIIVKKKKESLACFVTTNSSSSLSSILTLLPYRVFFLSLLPKTTFPLLLLPLLL